MKKAGIFCDPRYGPAMLKVAFDLKGPGAYKGFDRLFEESLAWLKISKNELEDYLAEYRPELERRCRQIGA